MPFIQKRLDRVAQTSRDIFDVYVYRPDNGDTIADIGEVGYFNEARFAGELIQSGLVLTYAADGFAIYFINNTDPERLEGGGRVTFTPDESPFANIASRDTWAAANLDELFNSTTQVTEIIVDGDLYRWSGDNVPASYSANQWLKVNSTLDAVEVKALYESNPDTNAFVDNEKDTVDSISSLPDNSIPISSSGGLSPSQLTQESLTRVSGEVEIKVFNRDALSFGDQYAIAEAGGTLLIRDKATGRRAIPCGIPVDFSVTLGEMITGKPYSVDWGEISFFNAQPLMESTRQGNYSFLAPVTFDRVITKFNVKLQSQVTGVRLTIRENNQSGAVIFKSHTDAEWQQGQGISIDANGDGVIDLLDPDIGTPILVETSIPLWVTVEKFQNPQDLFIVGTTVSPLNPGVFLPFTTQEYFIESRSELVNAKIYTPIYKNSTSPDLNIQDLQTIAADGSLGSFALSVDVSEVNVFQVFDFNGNWNSGSRKITVNLSNGDTYELTRSNRIYYFYKDESGNWQWYYETKRLG